MILWTKLFLEEQGYEIGKNVLYQDNKSAILLEKNGKRSSSKRTRALNIRYFFVTDQVEKGQLTIEYCPTGEMVADYMTKPLTGAAFVKMKKMLMEMKEQLDELRKAQAASVTVIANDIEAQSKKTHGLLQEQLLANATTRLLKPHGAAVQFALAVLKVAAARDTAAATDAVSAVATGLLTLEDASTKADDTTSEENAAVRRKLEAIVI
jgi:hypothetical protein